MKDIRLFLVIYTLFLSTSFAETFTWKPGSENAFKELDALEYNSDPLTEILLERELAGEFINVPEGSFLIGGLKDQGNSPIKQRYRVTIKAFELGKYEVTKGQFAAFVEATGYQTEAEKSVGGRLGCYGVIAFSRKSAYVPGTSWRDSGFSQGADNPVVCVSWNDAQAYIEWLNSRSKKNYRLPTESEWEYAARAGSESQFSFSGSDHDLCGYGNVFDKKAGSVNRGKYPVPCNDGNMFTAPVGSYKPNSWGLHDMHGNVWEWTEDCRNYSYWRPPHDGSAWKDGDCSDAMKRGGSWYDGVLGVRLDTRGWGSRDQRHKYNGFRLARDN
ncbi:MAG: formylglycine-generating enzyme family protein [Candidatus Thiodiazotropha taylori]|nr:formylglycine-generating enzyme family protein [Candidatus Thiodiazotropha taylori]